MEAGPPGGGQDPNHIHHQGCGCTEEMKMQDPNGQDLFPFIDIEGIQCFNERKAGLCKNVVRPLNERYNFEKGPLKSGYGKDMVIVIPFTCEVRVKCICLIGGDDNESPSKMNLFKNEEVVDISIQEERKAVQEIDLAEGDCDYPTNVAKFSSVSNLVIGVDGSFGARKTSLKFIGLKGEKLRNKVKVFDTVYEVRA